MPPCPLAMTKSAYLDGKASGGERLCIEMQLDKRYAS